MSRSCSNIYSVPPADLPFLQKSLEQALLNGLGARETVHPKGSNHYSVSRETVVSMEAQTKNLRMFSLFIVTKCPPFTCHF